MRDHRGRARSPSCRCPPRRTRACSASTCCEQGQRLDHLAARYLGRPGRLLAHLRAQRRDAAGGADRAREIEIPGKGGDVGLGIAIARRAAPPTPTLAGAASWVEVDERMGETTHFRLRYEVDVERRRLRPAHRRPARRRLPSSSVIVPVDGGNHCLVKGPVTGQQIHFEHGGAGSTSRSAGADTLDHDGSRGTLDVWSDVHRQRLPSIAILGSTGSSPTSTDVRRPLRRPSTRSSSARATCRSCAGWRAATAPVLGHLRRERRSRPRTSSGPPLDGEPARDLIAQPRRHQRRRARPARGTSSGRRASMAAQLDLNSTSQDIDGDGSRVAARGARLARTSRRSRGDTRVDLPRRARRRRRATSRRAARAR